MLRLAGPAGIDERSAREIMEEVRAAVSRWDELSDRAGVSVSTRGRVAKRLGR
jgi:hypothetical protein